MDGGDNGIPHSAYFSIPLGPSLLYVNQPKVLLAKEVDHVAITINIHVSRESC
jgi:hypothetical protein